MYYKSAVEAEMKIVFLAMKLKIFIKESEGIKG